MSGIGYPKGSPGYRAEASIAPAREAKLPRTTDGGGHWEGGAFIPDPVTAYGGMTLGQIIDAATPPPSPEAIERDRLRTRLMMTYSRESILKERIRLLEQAMANIEPQS